MKRTIQDLHDAANNCLIHSAMDNTHEPAAFIEAFVHGSMYEHEFMRNKVIEWANQCARMALTMQDNPPTLEKLVEISQKVEDHFKNVYLKQI